MKRITYLAPVSQLLSQNNTSMRLILPILVVLLSGYSLTLSAQTVVDFTTMTDAQTFGTHSQKDMGSGVFAMWAGDVDGDGILSYNGTTNSGNPTSPGNTDMYNDVVTNGGNFFNSPTFTYQAYNLFDIDLDGIISYNGTTFSGNPTTPGNTWLFNQVATHPGNFFNSPTFTFEQRLP